MSITKVLIKDFKRFSDLIIEGIPSTAQLVLLIGANGSGKSSVFKNLKVLRYYSIENYLFHPDNLAAYYNKINQKFDKKDYVDKLIATKNTIKNRLDFKLMSIRTSYPFYKEISQVKNNKRKWYINNSANTDCTEKVAKLLESDKLEDFYKVFPMKNHATQLPQRQNIPLSALTKTKWFKKKIEIIIS